MDNFLILQPSLKDTHKIHKNLRRNKKFCLSGRKQTKYETRSLSRLSLALEWIRFQSKRNAAKKSKPTTQKS